MKPEISTKNDNNPAALLRANRERICALSDPYLAKEEVLAIFHGAAMSPKNRAKAIQTVQRIDNVTQLQAFIFNYVLAADGLAVVG